jgi:hypothetical protein
MLEYALISAAGHGRRGVVELLLSKDPDLTVREPIWNNTAPDAAEYGGHPPIVALLKPLFQPVSGGHAPGPPVIRWCRREGFTQRQPRPP